MALLRERGLASNKRRPAQLAKGIMGFTMGIAYLASGAAMVFYSEYFKNLGPDVPKIMGGLFMAYSLFRIWRAWNQYTGKAN